MDYLAPKAPGDTVAYFIDWSKQLSDADTIASFYAETMVGTVVVATDPVNSGRVLRFVISGGDDGETAQIACVIYTAGGQQFTRTLQLPVSADASSVTPSTATKGQIVQMAFEDAGMPGYSFDATTAEDASALRRLDALMAQWSASGLNLNYNAPVSVGGSSLSDESGVPDDAINAVVSTLALRVAPGIGKTMSAEARVAYSQAMTALRARYTPAVNRRLPRGTPRGAGSKSLGVWQPFTGWGGVADRGGLLGPFILDQSNLDGVDVLS